MNELEEIELRDEEDGKDSDALLEGLQDVRGLQGF